jgi:hypothetical protein
MLKKSRGFLVKKRQKWGFLKKKFRGLNTKNIIKKEKPPFLGFFGAKPPTFIFTLINCKNKKI